MLEYLAVLLIGFWLGVAIFLYVSCYWLEEILDLPQNSSNRAAGSSSASSAHAQLKRLVARVVEEAAALPALARYAAEPHIPPESATYEDLLASAILNKVIERYQTENGSGGRSSGIHSASASPSPSDRSSPRTLNPRSIREITPPLNEEEDVSDWEEGTAEDVLGGTPKRVPFPEFGGDIVHQTDNDFRDFDEVSSSDIQAADGSWEENWLFQKKKLKTTQSVPVPMLVPNSNTEYKALIGDRDADDTTDLSDNASEGGDEEIEYKSDVKKVLDSKHVIGGKQKIDEYDVEPDSLTLIDESDDLKNIKFNDFIKHDDMYDSIEDNYSGKSNNQKEEIENNDSNNVLLMEVDGGPVPKAEFNLKEEIHRTMLNGHVEEYPADIVQLKDVDETDGYVSKDFSNQNGASGTLRSRHEREGEYEETVTVPVQRYADSLRRKHFEDDSEGISSSLDHDEELIPGSIADRERKKWLNYVDMPNNPYSPEAIKKRLTAKSTSSLFDMITSGKETTDDDFSRPPSNLETDSLNDVDVRRKLTTSASVDQIGRTKSRSESPSPKVLKSVLSEDIPQYKRYGRDYYIKEAKCSSGARAVYSSSTASTVSVAERCGPELASPVSEPSLSELEAAALRHNIVRAVLSPRNASPNFAINPIFEHPDKPNDPDNSTDESAVSDVRYSNGGDGYVENEDIIRLEIPKIPQMTEDLFEPYASVRRSNTLKSDDLNYRNKRPSLNFAFGGSLRLNKGFHKDLW